MIYCTIGFVSEMLISHLQRKKIFRTPRLFKQGHSEDDPVKFLFILGLYIPA